MQTTVFISDLHLDINRPAILVLLKKFLDDLVVTADAVGVADVRSDRDYYSTHSIESIYILGDFFALWVGDDDLTSFNMQVIALLKELVEKHGVRIYLLPGNRDFLLDAKFAHLSCCTLLRDPTVINLYGTPTLLTHGDVLCTQDKLMRVFRAVTHCRWCRKMFLSLPLNWRRKIAAYVRDLSAKKRRGNQDAAKKNLMIDDAMVRRLLRQYQARQMIHGHIHCRGAFCLAPKGVVTTLDTVPGYMHNFVPNIDAPNMRRIVLDEWTDICGSVLFYYADGSCELKQYQ